MNLANSIWYRNNAMFNVHGLAYSVLLYTVSVGFGIAYSVPRAMREPHERDKQSDRFPRSFYMLPSTQLSLQRQGNRAGKKLRPTRIREYTMEPRMIYEHLMRDAFNCKRFEYPFVNADYFDGAGRNHPAEYPIYVKCALIILLKNGNQHEDELKQAIRLIEENPSVENTDSILIDLSEKNILF